MRGSFVSEVNKVKQINMTQKKNQKLTPRNAANTAKIMPQIKMSINSEKKKLSFLSAHDV